MNLKVLVVDDERLARKELLNELAKIQDVEVVGECANHIEVSAFFEKGIEVDLMFLDIEMPEKNGFEVLESLIDAPDVIFVTAYNEYALRAFEVNALDYILKPLETERLEQAIAKVRKAKEEEEELADEGVNTPLKITDKIFIKDGNKCWFTNLSDVSLFESVGNYVKVYFNNEKPLILKSLNKLEERLDDKYFFRANRKHIINLSYIDRVEPWFNGGLKVFLKSGEEIEISRRQAVKFKNLLSL